jgi:hypothetical protein
MTHSAHEISTPSPVHLLYIVHMVGGFFLLSLRQSVRHAISNIAFTILRFSTFENLPIMISTGLVYDSCHQIFVNTFSSMFGGNASISLMWIV